MSLPFSLTHLSPERRTALLIGAMALVALLIGVIVVQPSLAPPRRAPLAETEAAAPPLAALPARPEDVASLRNTAKTPDEARALNAAVPFMPAMLVAARPFRFAGDAGDRFRAVECLALAQMAEAGGGTDDQRAVAQVILNRVRHPAFPKTVCGVVFQGSERVTGCQFTFTCDGAMARLHSEAAWGAARKVARAALDGYVFGAVGTATHYHTDWVHPVWSRELNKIAQVKTHLFFRWPGWWGGRDVLRGPYRGGEPLIAAMGWKTPEEEAAQTLAAGMLPTEAGPVAAVPRPGIFMIHLAQGSSADDAKDSARKLCKDASYCQVMGWFEKGQVPASFPISRPARATLNFIFTRDSAGQETQLYDCGAWPKVARERCLPKPRTAPGVPLADRPAGRVEGSMTVPKRPSDTAPKAGVTSEAR